VSSLLEDQIILLCQVLSCCHIAAGLKKLDAL